MPVTWKRLAFGEIAERRSERVDPQSLDGIYKCIELEHIVPSAGVIRGYTYAHMQLSSKNKFYVGDTLFGKLRPYLRKYALAQSEGLCSSEIWVLRNTGEVIPDYVYLIVQSERFLSAATKSSGTKMPRAEWDLVANATFPIPPLVEQRKIAAILSTWDRAIELLGAQIAAKQHLKRALMQRLLTGRLRFPGFGPPAARGGVPEGWKRVRLQDFLKLELRKVLKPNQGYLRLGVRSHGKGTFTTTVEDPDDVDMTHLYEIKTGDVIVSITFAWEGAIAMVGTDGNGALVSHRFPTFRIDTKKASPDFFRHVMISPRFFYDLRGVSPGGAGRNRVMSKKEFMQIWVSLPPLKEQQLIGALLASVDRETELIVKRRNHLETQKRGLMQKLLTGEVRVQG